jgi:hypothetical protein
VSAGRSFRAGIGIRLRAVVLAAVLPLAIAACGTVSMTAPPATPTDFPGITGRLNAVQIKVRNWVSGDAGCHDPDLVKSAISFDASGLDQAEPVRLYLYVFRDRAAFERHRDQVGPCAQSWVTDPQTYEEIEQSPYIVAGQGPWGTEFEATLRATLQEAAGTGG